MRFTSIPWPVRHANTAALPERRRPTASPALTVRWLAAGPWGDRLLAGMLLTWMALIPLLYMSFLGRPGAVLAGGLMVLALVLSGCAVRPSARRADAWVSLAALVAILGVAWLALPIMVRIDVTALVTAPFRAEASDGEHIAGAALLGALLLTLVWLGLGLAAREVRVPLGLLGAPALVGGLWLLVPGGRAGHLLPTLLLLLAALLVGRWIVRLAVGPKEANLPLAWIIGFCLGLGTIALVWLALGSLRLFTPLALALAVGALLLPAWRDVQRVPRACRAVGAWVAAPVALRANAVGIGASLLFVGLAITNLMATLAPDLMSDSVNQHLAVAATYARQGNFDSGLETNLYYWQIPLPVLYAGLIAWSGPIAAQALHYATGVLAVAGAGILAAHVTGQRTAGLVAAAAMSVPSLVWWLAPTGMTDLAVSFYFLAAICALVRWIETHQRGWLVITGLAAGVAVPAKLTNSVLAAILLVVIVAREWRSPRATLVALATCGLPALLIWFAWPLRSYVLAHNPVFPWLNQLFRSPLVPPVAVFAGIPWGIGTTPDALLRLPFAVTFHAQRFVESGELGAHFLALSPLLLLLPTARRLPHRSAVAVVGVAAGVFGIMWLFVLLQNLRYLLPAIPLLAALLGAGYACGARLRLGSLISSVATAALFIATIGNALNSWDMRTVSGRELPYNLVLGRQSEENYLSTYIPGYWAMRYLNTTYGTNAQVWSPSLASRVYSEARWFSNDALLTLPLQQALNELQSETDAGVLAARLRALGFTHVLANGWSRDMSLPEAKRPTYLRSDFLTGYAALEYADNGVVLYRLLAEGEHPPLWTERELLANGGFETGEGTAPDDWITSAIAGRWDRSGAMAHSGAAAVMLEANTAYYSRSVPVMPGRTYRLHVFASAPDQDTVGIFRIEFLDAEKQSIPRSWVGYYPDATYRQYELLATAPPDARYARVFLSTLALGKSMWVDDVSLVELIPE